jgi:hypothetical protein
VEAHSFCRGWSVGMFHFRSDRSVVSLVLQLHNQQSADAYVPDAANVTTGRARSWAGLEPLVPPAYEVLRWPTPVLGQFALPPAEVAAHGRPLELHLAYLSFRIAASVATTDTEGEVCLVGGSHLVHVPYVDGMTVAFPRRITIPDAGAERLAAWAGEGEPILSDSHIQELLETDL